MKKNNMEAKKFTVIKGGIGNTPASFSQTYISGYVTDTRLMGVVGLYMHWNIQREGGYDEELHQFFYLDAEEFGLESFYSVWGEQTIEYLQNEQKLVGGLGGRRIPVSEQEGLYILHDFLQINRQKQLSFPENHENFEFLLKKTPVLTDEEINTVMEKMCAPLEGPYEAIHYYLMRTFGLDQKGMEYLMAEAGKGNIFAVKKPATLCVNSIQIHEEDLDTATYLCESLIEWKNQYHIVTSEIILGSSDFKIREAKRHSFFKISPPEAAMMLNRQEFVTLYEIVTDPDSFETLLGPCVSTYMEAIHDNGR